MKIIKENEELVIRLPLWQDAFDCCGDKVGMIQSVVGVIAGNEQGISWLIDMTYKDKEPQIGDFIIKTDYSKNEFCKKCKEWGINFIEYPICGFCDRPIYGSFTFNLGKNMCYECEKNTRLKEVNVARIR